jgi:hypothetical protein
MVQFEKWKSALKDHDERIKAYNNFRSGLYTFVLGQHIDALQDKLKSHRDFEASILATPAYEGRMRLLNVLVQRDGTTHGSKVSSFKASALMS